MARRAAALFVVLLLALICTAPGSAAVAAGTLHDQATSQASASAHVVERKNH
jgi:hypothetical protein